MRERVSPKGRSARRQPNPLSTTAVRRDPSLRAHGTAQGTGAEGREAEAKDPSGTGTKDASNHLRGNCDGACPGEVLEPLRSLSEPDSGGNLIGPGLCWFRRIRRFGVAPVWLCLYGAP